MKTKKQKLPESIKIRLTPEESAKLHKLAAEHGAKLGRPLSVAEYVKAMVLS